MEQEERVVFDDRRLFPKCARVSLDFNSNKYYYVFLRRRKPISTASKRGIEDRTYTYQVRPFLALQAISRELRRHREHEAADPEGTPTRQRTLQVRLSRL